MFLTCYGRKVGKFWIYCALWQGVLMNWTAVSEIFHGEVCKIVGFKLKGTDKVLIGSVIDTQYVRGLMACLMKCSEHPRCNSFNFEETLSNNSQRCELNYEKKEGSSSKYFIVRLGFSYYELDGDIKSLMACSNVPCLNGGSCIHETAGKSFCKCATGYEGSFCENFYPKSCQDYQNNGNKTDGEYLLYLKRPECNQTAKIYCADMASTSWPLEYVTLPAGTTKNFAIYYNSNGNKREETTFEKIRLDVSTMGVSREDYKFATTDVPGAFHGYASAYDCISSSCNGNTKYGHFNVDITGTSFRLPPSIPYKFISYPVCVQKLFSPSMSTDRLRWSGKCGGGCGHCIPKELLLEIDGC